MIEKILLEINRLKDELDGYSAREGLDYIESYINTLSKQQQEQPSEDLEKAAKEYSKRVSDGHNYRDLICGFIAGAEWQEKQDLKWAGEIHKNGFNLCKEQMLEEAVEGYVNYYEDSGGILMAEAQVGCPYHNGDKVKIIIVKEDKK